VVGKICEQQPAVKMVGRRLSSIGLALVEAAVTAVA